MGLADDIAESQRPVESLPDAPWDVVVIGAGPGGAVCATRLAERGHRTLLVDRARFPRVKVCGEGLCPDACRGLARLGLLDTVRASGHTVHGVDIYSPSGIHLPIGGEFVMIRRVAMDAIVAANAVRAGAVFCHADVRGVEVAADGSVACTVAGGGSPLRARVGVIATGAELALAAGLAMADSPPPSGVALRCYVRSPSGPDRIVCAFERGLVPGYGWIFPMGGGEYNVGVSLFQMGRRLGRVNLRREFDSFARGQPDARRMMERAERVTPLRGGIIRCAMEGARPVGDGNVIATGETIGAVLPYTGEGIGKAMETGELAGAVVAEALERGDLSLLRRYGERIDAELRPRYAGYLRMQGWIARPRLCDLLTRVARHVRIARAAAAGFLAESFDPGKMLSVRGFVRLLRG